MSEYTCIHVHVDLSNDNAALLSLPLIAGTVQRAFLLHYKDHPSKAPRVSKDTVRQANHCILTLTTFPEKVGLKRMFHLFESSFSNL